MKDAASSPAAPAVGWASGPLRAVQAADRQIAHQSALRFRAVAEFAATRPASADRQPGEAGAMSAERRAARPDMLADVSEWAAQELVVGLSISQQAAEELLIRSLTLVHRLPATLTALEEGRLHVGHLWSILDKVAPIADATVRVRVEREVVAWIAKRSVTTPAQLGAKVRRTVLLHDASAAVQRLARALRERGVSMGPDGRDGMATVDALLTVSEAAALVEALGRHADALDDPADTRTRGQKMADVLLDLVLRPGEHDHAPVSLQLTVVAGVPSLLGGDQPGEVAGHVVPAEMVRALARAFGLLPAAAAPEVVAAPPVPVSTLTGVAEADVDLTTVPAAVLAAADERWWAEVEARALRGDWGGEPGPPPDVLERWWAQSSSRLPPDDPFGDGFPGSPLDGEDVPDPAPDPDESAGGWWARADTAVAEASSTMLELDRAMTRARRSVADAERASAADEGAWRQSAGGRITEARNSLEALAAVGADQRDSLTDLLRATAGGGLVDRPRIAVVDELTGALLALTDGIELRRLAERGEALAPPARTDGYRPRARLDRYVRARDRRCRFPGCRRRVPGGGELDHSRPWPEGATSAGNLTGFCTGHHRGKHQAPGWSFDLADGGNLTVQTPSGLMASTTPPPY